MGVQTRLTPMPVLIGAALTFCTAMSAPIIFWVGVLEERAPRAIADTHVIL